jgi:PAS domain S-box-containing protein
LNDRSFIQATVKDVSKEKKAADEISRLNIALNQTPTPVALTDLSGLFVYVNDSYCNLSGYEKEELLGKHISTLKNDVLSETLYSEILETVSAGQIWEGEIVNNKKTGSSYLEQATIAPVYSGSGEMTHVVKVAIDITEQRELENELIAAKEKAQESDRLKSAFLANMSHEIRTPMNGILGFTELLEQPDLTGEQRTKFIEIIKKSGRRMLDTVNDLIEISKIETGQVAIHLSPVSLNEQLDSFLNFFEREAKEKGLSLSLKTGLPSHNALIETDESKFNSIITNLVKNAIKYTDTGSIEFGYSLIEDDLGGHLQFYVKDTGIGIPKNRQKAVFRRFEQADIEDTRAFEGSGLGLAITKAYVMLLGGEIKLKSEEGVGSTFSFTLPYNLAGFINKEPVKKEEKQSLQTEKLYKILLVDDEEISLEYLRIILADSVSEVLLARNGKEAVRIFKKHQDFDVILMDMKMPLLDGFHATEEIRKINSEVIIIAQTAFAFAADRQKALNAGCDDYIPKPINKPELLSKIKTLQEKRK